MRRVDASAGVTFPHPALRTGRPGDGDLTPPRRHNQISTTPPAPRPRSTSPRRKIRAHSYNPQREASAGTVIRPADGTRFGTSNAKDDARQYERGASQRCPSEPEWIEPSQVPSPSPQGHSRVTPGSHSQPHRWIQAKPATHHEKHRKCSGRRQGTANSGRRLRRGPIPSIRILIGPSHWSSVW